MVIKYTTNEPVFIFIMEDEGRVACVQPETQLHTIDTVRGYTYFIFNSTSFSITPEKVPSVASSCKAFAT
jgi:hypothetical protein